MNVAAGQQAIRLGTRQHDEPPAERPHAEDRTQQAVLRQQEGSRVARQIESVAGKRQTGRARDLVRGARRRRGGSRRLGFPNGPGDGLADRIQLRHQVDPLLHLGALRAREKVIEDAAGVRQADDHRVARVRDVVAEQHAHDAQPDFLLHRAVGGRVVPPRPRYAAGQQEAGGSVAGFQDPATRQPRQRPLPNRLAPVVGMAPYPVVDVMRIGGQRDVGQRRVEQVVVERRPIDQHQPSRIRVDTVLQRQIHQHCPGQQNVQPSRRQRTGQVPAFVVEQEQQQLLGKSHEARGYRARPLRLQRHATMHAISPPSAMQGSTPRNAGSCAHKDSSHLVIGDYRNT